MSEANVLMAQEAACVAAEFSHIVAAANVTGPQNESKSVNCSSLPIIRAYRIHPRMAVTDPTPSGVTKTGGGGYGGVRLHRHRMSTTQGVWTVGGIGERALCAR
jgi:hypothetical protein